jgi:hypothetical protein
VSKQQVTFRDAVAMVSERLGIDQQQARARLMNAMSAGRLSYFGDEERFQSFIKEVEAYRRVEPRKPIKHGVEASLELMAESARQGALALFAFEHHATLERDDVLAWLKAPNKSRHRSNPKKRAADDVDDGELLAAIRVRYEVGDRPNVNQVAKDVQEQLGARNLRNRIREFAKRPEFDSLRGERGVRKRR